MRIFLRNAVWLPAMMLVPVLSEAQVWTSTAPMAQERVDHTATKLVSGEVLVAGGQYGIPYAIYDGSNILASAELYHYDPTTATGTWSATGSLNTPRSAHTATRLNSGEVLVVGGWTTGGLTDSAELYSYDPATRTGTWRPTGSLKTARSGHTATVLPSGEVLVWSGANSYSVSGECDLNVLACAELYDPVNGTWRATAPLATVRYSHTATLLDSGKVLIAGGDGIVGEAYGRLASAELYSYDPATGTGSSTGTGFMITPRTSHTATKLLSGKVLFVGGIGNSAPWLLASAELYSDDPATGTGTWSDTDTLLPERWGHTATLLGSGKALVVGGNGNAAGGGFAALARAEMYERKETWSEDHPLTTARYGHTATLLDSGQVLVVGGWNTVVGALASAELH